MKTILTLLYFALSVALCMASTDPSIDERLSELWRERKYDDLKIIFQKENTNKAPDITTLFCAHFFYIFIQPNKEEALKSITMVKAILEPTSSEGLKNIVANHLKKTEILSEEVIAKNTPEVTERLHSEFEKEYPALLMGKMLRKALNPEK